MYLFEKGRKIPVSSSPSMQPSFPSISAEPAHTSVTPGSSSISEELIAVVWSWTVYILRSCHLYGPHRARSGTCFKRKREKKKPSSQKVPQRRRKRTKTWPLQHQRASVLLVKSFMFNVTQINDRAASRRRLLPKSYLVCCIVLRPPSSGWVSWNELPRKGQTISNR